jgi:predicted regulator of Ras-like GTPase activity (Roadblock/LC7/MglB family)
MNDDVMVRARRDRLNWLLDDLVRRLTGAEEAIVLSGDGLLLGRSASLERDRVELEYGYLVVTEAGAGACLALLASVDADLGMVAYEMNVIVQQVGGSLSASPRALPAESSAPRSP